MSGAQAGAKISRVLAGPGSGKTRLLTQELQGQRTSGLPAASILGITFTRCAADELRERLSKDSPSDIPWIGTFHALARRIQAELKQLPDELNLDKLIPDANELLKKGMVPAWIRGLRFIGVDEAQDLDQSQVTFLNLMRGLSLKAEIFLVGDPDQMGQAVMRSPNIKVLPDPLRSSLRNLVALTDGRVIMIPAALGFNLDTVRAVHADLSLVAADARSGKVLWRGQAIGSGPTPSAALQTALTAALPLDAIGP